MEIIDGIVAKLDRAKEHMDALDQEVRSFYETKPYSFEHKFYRERDLDYVLVSTARIHQEIPARLSAIFGDGLYNLRSCLDHLVWHLAVSHVGINGDLDGTEFPIFDSKDRYFAIDRKGVRHTQGPVFRRSGLYKIRSIKPSAQAIIESLQPYYGGYNALLGDLQELNNIDKHRHFHIATFPLGRWEAGRPNGEDVIPFEDNIGFTIRSSELVTVPPLEDGAVVARFHVTVSEGLDFKVRVKATIPGDILLNEAASLSGISAAFILAGLIGFVRREVIPPLQPYLV